MRRSLGWLIVAGLLVSLLAAGVASYYASSSPDGLERVAADQGFDEHAQDNANAELPTADYGIAGIDDERLSVGLAGVLGVAVMAAVGFGLFRVLIAGKDRHPADG